jgi:hypothetical protein
MYLTLLHSLHHDSSQTQQAVALQEAALQQQMQQSFSGLQQQAIKQHPGADAPLNRHLPQHYQLQLSGILPNSPQLSLSMHHQSNPGVSHQPLLSELDEAPPIKPRRRKTLTFPQKLMTALTNYDTSNPSNDEEAMAWLPDGMYTCSV